MMRTPSPSAKRWFVPPPARTASFSSRRVEQAGLSPARGEGVGAATGERGHARETLKEIERGALRRQQRADGTPRRADEGAPGKHDTVLAVEPTGGAQPIEDPHRDVRAGEHELVLGEKAALPLHGGIEGGVAGDVAQEEVLLQREVDEPLDVEG